MTQDNTLQKRGVETRLSSTLSIKG